MRAGQLAKERPGEGLRATQDDADQHTQRGEDHEGLIRDEEGGDDDQGPSDQRPQDGLVGPDARGDPTKDEGPEEGHELHQQDQADQLALLEPELFGAVQA